MLRVSSPVAEPPPGVTPFFSLDKRKKQVTLYDPAALSVDAVSSAPEDRKVGVAAPKMFAFDAMFSHDDPQVCYLIPLR
jgi:kinesin family member 26